MEFQYPTDPDEAREIFLNVLIGSSDITKELLDELISNYGGDCNITIVDSMKDCREEEYISLKSLLIDHYVNTNRLDDIINLLPSDQSEYSDFCDEYSSNIEEDMEHTDKLLRSICLTLICDNTRGK